MVNGGVLVAEGENPVAMPIIRSLAEKGVNVAAMTSIKRPFARLSRYCRSLILVPSMTLEKEYVTAVGKIVKKIKFDVLFPVFELSLTLISKNRDNISRYVRLPIASHESILKCCDKLLTLKLAVEKGVPVPKTFFVNNFSELRKVAEEITYPAVVKPRWSMVWQGGKVFNRRGSFVNSPKELVDAYISIHRYFPFPLIQEYVPGINFSVAALYNNGKPRAFCCIKVHRAWPPTGGNSCYRESVELNPRMRFFSEQLLEALDWHGIAEVEFRLDSRDNVPKLMEINPRFWGSLCVAVKAGVDFPYLLYCMAMDGDVKGVFNYKIGVKGRFFEQELFYLFSLMINGSSNPIIKKNGRLNILASWLKFYETGIFYDLFEWGDPLPFLYGFASTPLSLIKFFREKRFVWGSPRVCS